MLAVLGVVALVAARSTVLRWRSDRSERALDRWIVALAADLGAAVRAGATLGVALSDAVASTATAPADGLRAALSATDRGRSLSEALDDWYRSVPSEAVGAFVGACRFHTEFGGDLAVSMDGVSTAISDRLEVDDETRALVAQSRTSAWVLAALPVVGAGVFGAVDPRVASTLLTTPLGAACIAAAVALDGVGLAVANGLIRRALR